MNDDPIPVDRATAATATITAQQWTAAATAHERFKALIETMPRAKARRDTALAEYHRGPDAEEAASEPGTASELGVSASALGGTRTPNLLIRRRSRRVRLVLSDDVLPGQVRCAVRPVLSSPAW